MKADAEMTFGEHLEELRTRIIRALLGILVATALCAIRHDDMFRLLLWPYQKAGRIESVDVVEAVKRLLRRGGERTDRPEPAPEAGPPEPAEPPAVTDPGARQRIEQLERLVERLRRDLDELEGRREIIPGGPIDPYLTLIIMCLLVGVLLASPWVLYQAWAFVGVGLYPNERRFVYKYTPFSFLLFFGGAVAFYFSSPYFLHALMAPTAGVDVIRHSYLLGKYAKFIALLTLVFGLAFQTPLVVLFLARTGLVSLETLARQQRTVILVMLIVGAFLTPADPVSMIGLAVPLIALYEVGLLLAWLSERRSRRRRPADEAEAP